MRSAVKQRMKKFKINELSSVDRPAQAPARAVIMKRKGDPDYVAKETDEDGNEIEKNSDTISLVTSVDDEHAHVLHVWEDESAGSTNYAVGSGEDDKDHSHPWIMDFAGNITIVMNAGHTHEVSREDVVAAVMATITKQELDEATVEKFQKLFPELTATPTPEDIQMDEDLKKANERLESIVALPATHRAHFDGIEKAEDQDAFLAKSAEERDGLAGAKVEKTESTPEPKVEKNTDVVYTANDGTVFTKSDDARLVAAIVEKDSKDAEIAALKLEKSDNEFEKRAEAELGHLPGTVTERAALLKAVEGIEDKDQRAAALKSLAAGNKANETNTTSLGTSERASVEKSAPVSELDKLTEVYAKDHGVSFAKAQSVVLATPEGKDLYNQHREAMIN